MNTEMVLDVNQGASDVLKEYEEGGIEFSKFLQMLEMLNSFSDVIRSLKLSENVNFIYRKEDIPKLISDERFLSIEPLKRDIENLLKIHSDKVLLDYFQVLTEKLEIISSNFISDFIENFYTRDKLLKIENNIEDFSKKIQELDQIVSELKEFKSEYEKERKLGFNKKELILIVISALLIVSSLFLVIFT